MLHRVLPCHAERFMLTVWIDSPDVNPLEESTLRITRSQLEDWCVCWSLPGCWSLPQLSFSGRALRFFIHLVYMATFALCGTQCVLSPPQTVRRGSASNVRVYMDGSRRQQLYFYPATFPQSQLCFLRIYSSKYTRPSIPGIDRWRRSLHPLLLPPRHPHQRQAGVLRVLEAFAGSARAFERRVRGAV